MKREWFALKNVPNILGILGVLAVIVVPFIAVGTNFKIGGAGGGILLIGTYLEYSPYFSQSIWRRILGVFVLIIVAVLAMVYAFAILSLTNN